MKTILWALTLALLVTLGCDLAASGGNIRQPSSLDIAERQQEVEASSKAAKQYLQDLKDWGRAPAGCQGLLDDAKVREQAISQAIVLATLDDDKKERYQLLGKKRELYDDLVADLKKCSGFGGVLR